MSDENALIVQALAALRGDIQQVRAEQTAGFSEVRNHLTILNGRTAKTEQSVAALDERTSHLSCVEHGEQFGELGSDLKTMDADMHRFETRIEVVEHGVVSLGNDVERVGKEVHTVRLRQAAGGLSKAQIALLVSLITAAAAVSDIVIKWSGLVK